MGVNTSVRLSLRNCEIFSQVFFRLSVEDERRKRETFFPFPAKSVQYMREREIEGKKREARHWISYVKDWSNRN